jgi:hypothetical protein
MERAVLAHGGSLKTQKTCVKSFHLALAMGDSVFKLRHTACRTSVSWAAFHRPSSLQDSKGKSRAAFSKCLVVHLTRSLGNPRVKFLFVS